MINLIVAIPCEAKPLIRHLRLQKQAYRSYNLFSRNDIRLLVCGVGKLAAASACAWLQGLTEQSVNQSTDAWLNIGIAGHGFQPLGTGLLAHRISEYNSDRRWYPGFTFRPPCPSSALISVDQPETRYLDNALYDMEASGFYASCSRFASIELVHCFKVVSDNQYSGIGDINEAKVMELIQAQLPTLDVIIEQLRHSYQQLALQQQSPAELSACLERWHFSHYQTQQLRQLLIRRQTLMPEQPLWQPGLAELKNARQVLAYLLQQLEQQPVCFNK
jgi:hypothetical protein